MHSSIFISSVSQVVCKGPDHAHSLISFSCLPKEAFNLWLPTECPARLPESLLGTHAILLEMIFLPHFLISHGNIFYGYVSELPQRGISNDYPQHFLMQK